MTFARKPRDGLKARAFQVILFSGLALTLSIPARSQNDGPRIDKRVARRLEKGTSISIRARNQPLSAILSKIEKSTRVKVRVKDEFGRPANDALSKRLTLTLNKVPFWDAFNAIEELTQLKFKALEEGSVVLATKLLGSRSQDEATAKPLVSGAFLLTPELNLFKKPQIRMRPEPWIHGLYTSDYKAKLTFKGGRIVDYEPIFPVQGAGGRLTGEILLPIDPKLDDALPAIAERLELEATVAFAQSKKTVETAPLSSLLAKPQRFGDQRVVVQKIERTADGKRVAIELEVEGTRLLASDLQLLVDGKSVKRARYGAYVVFDRQLLELEFEAPAAKLKDVQLKLNLPRIAKKTFGVVGELEGKTLKLGERRLEVVKARARGKSGFLIEIRVSGGELFGDSISLTAKNGKKVSSNSSSSTRKGIQTIRASFYDLISKTSFGDCRLAVEYPSKAVSRILKNLPGMAATSVEELGLKLRVLSAGLREEKDGRREYRVRLHLSGPKMLPTDVQLLDSKGKPVRLGWNSSGSPDSAFLELMVPTESIQGGLTRHRLRLAIPDKLATYLLKATFKDFVLKK